MGQANTLYHLKSHPLSPEISLFSDVFIPLSCRIKMVSVVEPFREVLGHTQVSGIGGAVPRGHVLCNIVSSPSGMTWRPSSQVRRSG